MTDGAAEVVTITNNYRYDYVKLHGIKTWDDENDYDGLRPDKLVIKIMNGESVAEEIEVKAVKGSNDWSWESSLLPKYNTNGSLIDYTVIEILPEHYTQTVNEGSITDGFRFTNSHQPEVVSVSGKKLWDEADGVKTFRPATIEITLLADEGTAYDYEGNKVGKLTLTVSDEMTFGWDNLPKYKDGKLIKYSIKEEVIKYYTPKLEGPVKTENGYEFVLTNSFTPDTTEVTVNKTWIDDENQDGLRPVGLWVQLYEDKLIDKAIGDPVKLTAADGWSYTWKDLPSIKDTLFGEKNYNYTVKEISVVILENGIEKEIPMSDFKEYKQIYKTSDEAIANTINLYNEHESELIDLEGSKTWVDDNNQDGLRPDSITINLWKEGSEIPVDTKVVKPDEEGNWSWKFEKLPKFEAGKEIKYFITEDAVWGYETFVNGFDVTNTHESEEIDISGSKIWIGDDDGVRPTSITVVLYANGMEKLSATVTPDANGDWAFSFGDLPKYEGGKEIEYSIGEVQVNGYTLVIDPTVNYEEGTIFFKLTNTYVPPTPGETPTPTPRDEPTPTPDSGETPTPGDDTETPPGNQPTPSPTGEVLGAKRVEEGGAVLGARRGPQYAVLGKRRRPQTGDSMALILWAIALGVSATGAVISLTVMHYGKKRED